MTWRLPADEASGDFIGSDGCRSCHNAEFVQFGKTSHAHLESDSRSVMSCESCHGPGKKHADAMAAAGGDEAKTAAAMKLIFAFKGNAKENSDRCLSCHVTGKTQDRFQHSAHAAANVSCSSCHSSHLVKAVRDESRGGAPSPQTLFFQVPERAVDRQWMDGSLLKSSQPELCYTCHATVRSQFALPTHHRVPEGLMTCSDCHSPHGSANAASLVKTSTETCVRCHTEKRGPFVYEHPASKIDGCVICHSPHGSANRMLLVRREGRQLCLQCHLGFNGLVQEPHTKLGFQTSGECTRCHVAVHGSNFDVTLLR
ncbi:MAG TPA: cytochrome c3 family protein [Terriglobia bacterium]|nr:cytochrome c3 family protein [Terriglobia bacterium]